MKKTVVLVLCLIMVMTLAAGALAKLPGGGFVIGGNPKVTAFIDKVNEIGDPVTLADEETIEEAYDLAYAPISDTSTNTVYAIYLNRESMRVNAAGADAWDKLEAAAAALEALKEGGAAEQPTTPPTQAPTQAPTKPSTPAEPVDPAGDNTFVVMAMVVLSMTAVVVLVSKKRAF